MRGFMLLTALILGGCVQAPEVHQRVGDGVNVPTFEASARCPDLGEDLSVWLPDYGSERMCGLFEPTRQDRLEAPSGGRAYRETWHSITLGEGGSGHITLKVYPDGRRTLQTSWKRGSYTLKKDELPGFEAALAKSRFAELPILVEPAREQFETEGHDVVCLDGVPTSVEAVIDGTYRLVYFGPCGGVFVKDVAAALDQLFVFAARVTGGKHPFDPEHPTWSW